MNLEQAIKTALEFENKVQATYEEAKVKASDPIGKRIFSILAQEEQKHVQFLNHCLGSWKANGKIDVSTLDTAIPSADQVRSGLEKMRNRVNEKGPAASDLETELLQKALEAEQQTSGFYKKMVAELDEQGKKLFARFVEIEEGHVAIVQAELDSVQGLGYWFDMPEWQFQDG